MSVVVAVWEEEGRRRPKRPPAAIGMVLLVLDRCIIAPPRAALPAPAICGTGGEISLRCSALPRRQRRRNRRASRIRIRPAIPPTILPTRTLAGGAPSPPPDPAAALVVATGLSLEVGVPPIMSPPTVVLDDGNNGDEVDDDVVKDV